MTQCNLKKQLSTTFEVPSRSKHCYTRNKDFSAYRVVAGLGPVPSFFRAPDDVYVSLNSPKDLGGYLGGVMWYEESATPGVVREVTIGDWMYERISTGCLQVYKKEAKRRKQDGNLLRYGTTIEPYDDICENEAMTFVPHVDKETDDGEVNGQKWIGIIDECCESDFASSTCIEQKVFTNTIGDNGYPTLRDSNGTPYFVVSSGGLAVANLDKEEDAVIMRNCANGKWYWKLNRDLQLEIEQFDIWHESVAGNTELDSNSFSRFYFWNRIASMTEVEQFWEEAKEKVACLSRLDADVISLVCQFMTTDPDSDFWVKKELADGFLLHHKRFSTHRTVGFFDAAQYRSETALLPHGKYLFEEEPVFSILRTRTSAAFPGCAFPCHYSLFGVVMFKRDPTTNKIVIGRFRTENITWLRISEHLLFRLCDV